MQDLFQKCHDFREVDKIRAAGVYPYFRSLTSKQGPVVNMEGKRRIMLGSNNYLGLSSDPRVIAAAQAATEKYGTGCSGSRFLNGTLDLHLELEKELADFLHKEDAIVFSTGFQSNLAILSSITGRNDIILSDAFNHASLVDGCRLSLARNYKYRHSDMEDLEKKLQLAAESAQGGILIVSDGVFSMEGDICRLSEITTLARRYGARVFLDDAHSLGVLGPGGRGTAAYFGLENEVDLIMNTFSKTLASLGGSVAGSAEAVSYIRHKARPFIFSASLPPAQVETARTALQILQDEPWRTERLHTITRKMRAAFRTLPKLQLHDSGNELVPIISLLTGGVLETLRCSMQLYEAGVYVNSVLPPAVAESACLLRTSYMATHSDEELDEALAIMHRVLSA